MSAVDLKGKSTEELWVLYEEVRATLARKLTAEKNALDERLRRLGSSVVSSATRAAAQQAAGKPRRPYPKVHPKYRNPKKTSETWSGRGKQPRWLVAEMKRGKKLADFLIKR